MPTEASQDPVVLAIRVQALEQAVEHLVKVQQANHEQILRAFYLTDAHLWVLKKIQDDRVMGISKVTDADANQIDYAGYYKAFEEFHTNLQKARAEEAAKTKTEEVEGGSPDVASP